MYSKNEIEYLEKQLDKLVGDRIKQVADRSGKSRPTVSRFFNLENIRSSSAEQIYDACIDLIEEKSNKRKATARRIKQIDNELDDSLQTSLNLK